MCSSDLFPVLVRSPDPNWLLVEEGFTLAREHEVESLFAIANGYVGNRGCLAEGSALSAPATFIAGVFEHPQTPGAVPQLMTLPDWAGVRIWISDEPLSIERGQVLEHRRVLRLRRGMLWGGGGGAGAPPGGVSPFWGLVALSAGRARFFCSL